MSYLQKINSKIVSLDQAKLISKSWTKDQQKIVFTNGCFDLIHLGHIDYLSKAADLGDKLVIGVNTDSSVTQLKGSHRPIKNEKSRTTILAALEFVNLVILFSEKTPINLVNTLKPDILVKGSDYSFNEVVGAKETLENGGRVELIDFIEGYSSSLIESKIRNHP